MDAKVSALFVYPVKSCRGISLVQSVLEPRGLRYDRRWMVVDANRTFVTQRSEPRLALVKTSMEEDALVLESPGMPALRLPLVDPSLGSSRSPSRSRSVRVWRDDVQATDCGDEAAAWLTRWLGSPSSLVFMPDDTRRPLNPDYAFPNDVVSFADGFPVLIAARSSLDDLNLRMGSPVSMDRFRPNIVVSGCAPWAEDSWARIRVAQVPIRLPKPCERCVVTTVDQGTAERGIEPMRTLAMTRQRNHAVLFAQNGVGEATGVLAVGDPVTVLERR